MPEQRRFICSHSPLGILGYFEDSQKHYRTTQTWASSLIAFSVHVETLGFLANEHLQMSGYKGDGFMEMLFSLVLVLFHRIHHFSRLICRIEHAGCFSSLLLSYFSLPCHSVSCDIMWFQNVWFRSAIVWPAWDCNNVMLDPGCFAKWWMKVFQIQITYLFFKFYFRITTVVKFYSVWHTFIWWPYYLIMMCLWLFAFLLEF